MIIAKGMPVEAAWRLSSILPAVAPRWRRHCSNDNQLSLNVDSVMHAPLLAKIISQSKMQEMSSETPIVIHVHTSSASFHELELKFGLHGNGT